LYGSCNVGSSEERRRRRRRRRRREYGSVRRRVDHVASYDYCDIALLFCSEERVVTPKSVPGSEEPLFGSEEPILGSEEPIFAPKSVSCSEEHHFAYRRFVGASWLRCRVAADGVGRVLLLRTHLSSL